MSRRKPSDVKDGMPNLYLYWPEFIGLWRNVDVPLKYWEFPGASIEERQRATGAP